MQSINGIQPENSSLVKRNITDSNQTNTSNPEDLEPPLKKIEKTQEEKAELFNKGLLLKEEFKTEEPIPTFRTLQQRPIAQRRVQNRRTDSHF